MGSEPVDTREEVRRLLSVYEHQRAMNVCGGTENSVMIRGCFVDDLVAMIDDDGADEITALRERVAELDRTARSLLLTIDGIEAHCRNEAGLKGIDHADDGKRVRHAMNLVAETARALLSNREPQS